MKPYLKVTADFTKEFNAIIKQFKHDAVLVGIPEEDTSRKADPKDKTAPVEKITNAALLAINQFGSPKNNIPARPVMTIGIKNAQEEIANLLKQGAAMALSKGFAAIDIYYNRAGIVASNSIKKAINAQEGFDGPADSTLASRKSKGFTGTKALIVTAQMRNAITYVIRGKP